MLDFLLKIAPSVLAAGWVYVWIIEAVTAAVRGDYFRAANGLGFAFGLLAAMLAYLIGKSSRN